MDYVKGCLKMIEKTRYINDLLDVYETLLTKKQQEVMIYYFKEDFSLKEIAEYFRISRAAVQDHIKRSEEILENYERLLKMVAKAKFRLGIYEKMKVIASSEVQEMIVMLEKAEKEDNV